MALNTLAGPLYAPAATTAIGLSVAVSELLIHYPVLSARAVRSLHV
jgi:alkanesulfonate monooxygenase SsuD/methylene tetrahydromethanopterin reductase-like flavin-dependent oxidoreductase (luciferase family)